MEAEKGRLAHERNYSTVGISVMRSGRSRRESSARAGVSLGLAGARLLGGDAVHQGPVTGASMAVISMGGCCGWRKAFR
jgi:hypothetical protein